MTPRAAAIRLPGHPVSRLRSRDSVWIGGGSARCPQGNAAAPDDRLDLGRPHGRGERERVFHPPNQAVGAVEPDPPAGHLYADLAPARGLACPPSQDPQASQHNGVPFRRRSGDRRRVHPAARAHHACRGAESVVGWQRALALVSDRGTTYRRVATVARSRSAKARAKLGERLAQITNAAPGNFAHLRLRGSQPPRPSSRAALL